MPAAREGKAKVRHENAPGTIDVLGAAASSATVAVALNNGTPQSTTRQGEVFHRQVAVANSAAAQNAQLKITGVRNLAGPAGQDVVAELTTTAFVPQTPEAFAHDADGNLIADARWTYTWDAENRLVALETATPAAAAGVARRKLEFAYDGQGRRLAKKVSTWSGTAWILATHTLFLYDGWNLLAEMNALSSNAAVRTYTWGLDLSGGFQGAGGVGGLLLSTFNSPSSTCAPAYDGNGNVAALVGMADGALAARYDYNAFGETVLSEGPQAAAHPFGFSTKFTDAETGHLYYGYRCYNPQTGRWLSRDPSEESGGNNLYGFVGNSPQGSFDSQGRYQLDIHFYATYAIAKANGLDAYTLAYYAQYPDQDLTYDAIPAGARSIVRMLFRQRVNEFDRSIQRLLHSLHGGNDVQVRIWKTCLEGMVRREPDGWQRGFLIHALGDSFSHVKADFSAYKFPEGHLEDGTDPDIPQARPDVLRDYLTTLNRALGGKADVAAIVSQFSREPARQLIERRIPGRMSAGADVYESRTVARFRQAREASGYSGSFDPHQAFAFRKPPLDLEKDQISPGDVTRLLERMKRQCGCVIGL